MSWGLATAVHTERDCLGLQCDHPFDFPPEKYSEEERDVLVPRVSKVNILTSDAGYEEAFSMPPNAHFVPFATNFHYVPQRPGAAVAIAGDHVGRPPDWDGGTFVAHPPAPQPWAPAQLLAHKRPILASYIGTNSRKHKTSGETGRGWQLKQAVCT
jgi:hypothetical protein